MNRLNRRDFRLIGLAAVLAAVSLVVTQRYFHRAFPEASIDFSVSIDSSATLADHFLAARGLSTAGYQHASQFRYDDEAKTFLERELGAEKTGELLRGRVRLWQWANRWFRPLQKEEFNVLVTTGGSVVGFDHALPEDAPGDSLSEGEARGRADAFLVGVMRIDTTTLARVSTERKVRPHRVDYDFVWKDTAALVAGATGFIAQAEYRHEILVKGGAVATYTEFLKVPDQWARDYDQLRSKNELAGTIDTGLLVVVGIALLVVLVQRMRRGDIDWHTARWVGGTGAVLSLLSSLNSLGAALYGYDTTQSHGAFLAETLIAAIAAAVSVGAALAVLTASAEPVYREAYPDKMSLAGLLSWRGVRTKPFFISVLLGAALAAFFFAYQTVFYLVANHFGAWAPMDVPYDDLLNTKLPWAFVLFGGFFPAVSEEFTFRMFSIPLFSKWFRSVAVAVVAASYLWGFGHATYPNQPFYIRGLEVGTGGLLLSWIMLRYGILTTFVWHYTVDAVYTAMLLLRAHEPYLRFSGAVTGFIALIPLLVAGIAYWRTGTFAEETGLRNEDRAVPARGGGAEVVVAEMPASSEVSDESVVEAAAVAAQLEAVPGAVVLDAREERVSTSEPGHGASRKSWILGVVLGGVFVAAAFAVMPGHTLSVASTSWEAALPVRVTPAKAEATARQFLRNQGYDVTSYRVAVEPATPPIDTDLVAASEIYAKRGQPALIRAFSGPSPTVLAEYWYLRFFKPLQEEEFAVAVRPDTAIVTGWDHTLPETTAGASPSLPQAETTAVAFLGRNAIDTAGFVLATATQEHRAARTDSRFVWERRSPSPLPGEVTYRLETDLDGAAVAHVSSWYHVPEARIRELAKPTAWSILITIIRVIVGLAGIWLAGSVLGRAARSPLVRAGPVVMVGLACGIVHLILSINALPRDIAYPTDTPWSSFLVSEGVGFVVGGAAVALLAMAIAAAFLVMTPGAAVSPAGYWRVATQPRRAREALGAAFLAVLVAGGWASLGQALEARLHFGGSPMMPSIDAGLAMHVPGITSLLSGLLFSVIGAGVVVTLVAVVRQWWVTRRMRLLWIAAILVWAVSLPSSHSVQEVLLSGLLSAAGLGVMIWFVATYLRDNALGYLTAIVLSTLSVAGEQWWHLPGMMARVTSCLAIVGALAMLAWLFLLARRPVGGA